MRARVAALLLLAGPGSLVGAAPAAARRAAPHLHALRCVPASACHGPARLEVGRQVQLQGSGLYRGMRVTFRWSTGALATKLHHSRTGWVARIPAGTHAGAVGVTVRDAARRRSNSLALTVVLPPPPPPPPASQLPASGPLPAAFSGQGMWIWQLPKSDGGDPVAIARQAQADGIATLFVKSSDGTSAWPQFNPQLVQTLHGYGLRVCAWQFAYGTHPEQEAQVGAQAVADGADCLVVDAETSYEGRYSAAQRYLTTLRAAIGPDYPLGLTSFPYVDYHPGLPYSVFFGPGGAQANVPQVYWKEIGDTVDAASAHTFAHNRIYGAPIAPLGQAYDAPGAPAIARFRALWAGYGAAGLSWWDWQSAADATFAALAQPAPPPAPFVDPGWPALGKGAKGDEVLWLQEHLSSSDPSVPVDGVFGSSTDASLRAFQAAHGIPVTGTTDAATWQAALALPLRTVDWTSSPAPASARSARTARAAGHRAEIPSLGAGG